MAFALLIALTGCLLVNQADLTSDQIVPPGIDEAEFYDRYVQAFCALADECGYIDTLGGSIDACVEALSDTQLDSGCDYDPVAAEECAKDMERAGCEVWEGTLPDSCAAICQ